MSQIIPIYIPTYISDQTYNPSRVLPRLLFYNGMIDCQTWYIESGSTAFGGTAFEQNAFPYFDNYNVVSGSFPTTDSKSLLFYNEQAVYGETPIESLYSEYWEKYVELLYNPRTRLLNASTIIPLADYFKMELNDIVELRGNYYHLRAINDYNLKNGECNIQLLGPILDDVINTIINRTSTTTTSTTSTSTTTSSTTTTTAVVNPCRCYEVIFGASGGEITYNDCDGVTFNFVSMGATTIYQCVQVIGGLAQIFVVSGDVTLSIVGNCLTQACPPTTTTTSTSTSTSTTSTSTSTSTTTTTTACVDCGINQYGTYSPANYYGYPTASICNAVSSSNILFYYGYDRPNRFTLYDSAGFVTSSGWVGYATYAGPWGASNNVDPDGNILFSFNSGTGRYMLVEAGPADPVSPISDAYEWVLVCQNPTTTTSTTTTTTPPLAATGVNGYMQPCVGGTIDDFMGASVNTNSPVSVDTDFGVDVKYVLPGNACGVGESTQSFTITIESGSQSSNFDACLYGAYFSSGATICSACVSSCDNPAVDISAVDC
jgi:hypothetical protein